MANDLNRCEFIGRLGRDPETRYLPDGKAVTNFSIAVGWKTKSNEGAEWVSLTAFDKLGDICGQYLKKGSQVFVSGRFKTEEFEKDGIKRYSTKIILDQMQMLGGKNEGASDNDSGASRQAPRESIQDRNNKRVQQASNFSDMDDDIPF